MDPIDETVHPILIRDLQPGDIVVLRVRDHCSQVVRDLIRDQARKVFSGDVKVLVLEDGMEIEVYRMDGSSGPMP